MAYGKKNVISTDLSRLVFGLLGEPGIGKTSTIYKMAEKEFGEDSYLLLDIGSEWGSEYIDGVVAEQTETFKKFLDVTNDIIKNKETEYPSLKVIICDTIDALFEIGEPYLVKLYNSEHMGEKNFKPAVTINGAEGGFMHGQDRLIEIVINQIVKLRKIGVGFWYTGHVKRRSNDDAFSGESYDMITTNMSQRYFAAIRNKSHAIGIAYIDRTLTQQEIGKENPVTKEKKTITRIVSESRKVKFRDDSYTADSKSRLEGIAEEVLLDADEILQALREAVGASGSKSSTPKKSTKSTPAPTPKPTKEDTEEFDEEVVEDSSVEIDDIFDDEEQEEVVDKKAMMSDIRSKFKVASDPIKKEIKSILTEHSNGKLSEDLSVDILKQIERLLTTK